MTLLSALLLIVKRHPTLRFQTKWTCDHDVALEGRITSFSSSSSMSALSAVYFSVETCFDAALFGLVSHPVAFTVNSIGGTISMERPLAE